MKKFMILSTAVLGVCFAAPFTGKATLPSEKTNDPALQSTSVVKSTIHSPDRTVYIVTKASGIGTRVPTVYRIYQGRVTTATSKPATTFSDLSPAGAEDVAGSLVKLDPSITLGVHRR